MLNIVNVGCGFTWFIYYLSTRILEVYFTCTAAILNTNEAIMKDMGKLDLYQYTTKHNKARSVCVDIGAYCIHRPTEYHLNGLMAQE